MQTNRTVHDLLTEARSWIGTPYQHQATTKGAGCDCLGLIRGLYRYLYSEEPETPPPYAPEWGEVSAHDPLWQAASTYLTPAPQEAEPGQVLLFRWTPHSPCKHLGLLSAHNRFIHAYEPVGVVESPLVPLWRKRIAGRFHILSP